MRIIASRNRTALDGVLARDRAEDRVFARRVSAIVDRVRRGGDRALAAVGQLLLGRFRREDLRARWGGEEFALAFPGEIVPTVHGVVAKVLAELRAIVFQGDDGQPFHVTFSAGIATFPEDGLSAHALLSTADRRLRRAKVAGRAAILAVG